MGEETARIVAPSTQERTTRRHAAGVVNFEALVPTTLTESVVEKTILTAGGKLRSAVDEGDRTFDLVAVALRALCSRPNTHRATFNVRFGTLRCRRVPSPDRS